MPVECPQCNTSNSDEVLYCTACGKLLVPYESEEPVEEPAQTFASRISRLVAALLDGAIAGAAYLVLLFSSPALGLLLLLAIFIVQAVLLTRDGQSLGKKASAAERDARWSSRSSPTMCPLNPMSPNLCRN